MYVYATLSNENREHKKQSLKRTRKHRRDDYQQRREQIDRKVFHMANRYGYNYNYFCQKYDRYYDQTYNRHKYRNPILDKMFQEFQNKVVNYIGSCPYVKKISRKKKMQIKERLGIRLKKNPIIHSLNQVDKINVFFYKCLAFRMLKSIKQAAESQDQEQFREEDQNFQLKQEEESDLSDIE